MNIYVFADNPLCNPLVNSSNNISIHLMQLKNYAITTVKLHGISINTYLMSTHFAKKNPISRDLLCHVLSPPSSGACVVTGHW